MSAIVCHCVMAGFDPAIHHFRTRLCEDRWIRGSSPRMTSLVIQRLPLFFVLSKTLGVMLLPTNFLIGVGLRRRHSAGHAICVARPQAGDRGGAAARDLRVFAARKSLALSAGAALSAVGCRARRAGRHHRARRLDRRRSFGRAWHAGGPRRAGPRSSRRRRWRSRYPNARIVFSGGSANLISNDAREADYAGAHLRKPRHRQVAADHGAALAQHPGECRILQGAGRAEDRASAGCW